MKKLIFVSLLILLMVPFVSAKSFYLEKAEINMDLLPDGSIDMEEIITFNFVGSFSYAYRDFDYKYENIDEIEVYDYDTGKLLRTDISGGDKPSRVKWYYSARDEKRRFVIKYNLKHAIKSYEDVHEFYWKIWGDGWDPKLREIYGNLSLPKKVSDSKEVYTWGHPDLEGKIAMLNNQDVIFQAFNIPSHQWVELRVVFPKYVLEDPIYTRNFEREGLDEIINEEENYEKMETAYNYLWFLLPPIPALIVIFGFIFLYLKYGREPEVEYDKIYEREIPYDYSPAIVSALLNQDSKKPNPNDFVAVILNLCLKGYCKIEKKDKEKVWGLFGGGPEYIIHFSKRPSKTELSKHESEAYKILKRYSDGKDQISFSELSNNARSDFTFRKKFTDWQKEVKKEAIASGFYSKPDANLLFIWFWGGSFALFLISIAIFTSTQIELFSALGIGAFIGGWIGVMMIAIFRQALPRRTQKGALHYKKWKALQKYLNDVSQMKKHPPESIALWEKFLVYAVSLGAADKVQKAMNLVLPSGQYRSAIFIGHVNYSALASSSFVNSVNSFSSSFGSASGTSGSGGFGGGGGGAGGGGGGGAG